MNFIVQKINGELILDFCQELRNSQRYWEWRGNPFSIMYVEKEVPKGLDNPDDYIPIGTIEFVKSYVNYYYPNKTECLKPINIPDSLIPYAGRSIFNIKSVSDISEHTNKIIGTGTSKIFRKSLNVIKDPTNGIIEYHSSNDIIGYQISDIIPNIESEWRVFVHNNQIKQVCYYSGDPLSFPDSNTLRRLINDWYKDPPVAYTLDVYTTNIGTYVMEVHRFFSCGLYGFSDPSLPYMFSQEWFEMMNL